VAAAINILRPIGTETFMSASIFERNFRQYIGQVAQITPISYIDLFKNILTNKPASQREMQKRALELAKSVEGFDYICCAYDSLLMFPLILGLRNTANIDIRVIIISHSPAVYCYEWAMAGPLLQPGDIIIAQSKSGREAIEFLYPDLLPFIKQTHSPMPFLDEAAAIEKKEKLLVTLARIHEDKLIHRQIEALEILHHKYRQKVKMHIAGSLVDKDTGKETVYARLLKKKIKHMGMERWIKLIGPLKTPREKARFLARGCISINLSGSLEESYPKATIEALGMGIPVLATHWNGMRNTVGKAGGLVDMKLKKNGHIDVEPGKVADGIAQLLNNPIPAEKCREQAAKFLPEKSMSNYHGILNHQLKYKDFSSGLKPWEEQAKKCLYKQGPFSRNPFLNSYTYRELFDIYWDYANLHIERETGIKSRDTTCLGEKIQAYLLLSLKKMSQCFMARVDSHHLIQLTPLSNKVIDDDKIQDPLIKKILRTAKNNVFIPYKEVACAALLVENEGKVLGELDFSDLERSEHSISYDYFMIEKLLMQKKNQEAFEYFTSQMHHEELDECDDVFVKQMCRIAAALDKPRLALPWIESWLQLYPYAPSAAGIWLRKAHVYWMCGKKYYDHARQAIDQVKELFPHDPLVAKLDKNIQQLKTAGLLNTGKEN
jgi:glycosyltransferase involved in cell wall biosynthesis